MSTTFYRSGAVLPYIPYEVPSKTIPSFASLSISASTVLVEQQFFNINDRRGQLDQTATYQVCLMPMGHNPTSQGFAATVASPASGFLQPTSLLPFIRIEVNTISWPADVDYSAGIMIWLKKNSGNFYLHSILPPDSTQTIWSTVLLTDVQTDAISEPYSTLSNSAITDAVLTKRTGITGTAFVSAGTMEDPGLALEDATEQIQYKPATATSYQLAVTRGLKVSFKILQNDPQNFVASSAGEWVRYTTSGGKTSEVTLRAYQASGAINTGNWPLKLLFPINQNKAVEVLYMYAALRQNQTGGTSQWGKSEPPTLSYVFETVNADTLLQGVHAVSSVIREN